MMGKAGVAPAEVRVRLGDPKLTEITGAREPSGVPVVDEPEPRRERPRGRFGDRPQRSYGDRPQRSYGDRPERSYGDRPERSDRGFAPRNGERTGGFRRDNQRNDRRDGSSGRFGARPARTF